MANFFKSILWVKTGEVEGELLNSYIKKWYNKWLRLLTMLLPGRIYIAPGPWHSGDFRNIFFLNIGKDQKSLTISALGPLCWYCAILW